MGVNVQCPVCTLFLLPGMDLSDHLETHPKEQVIKALVQMSLKTETSETPATPDTPKKTNKISFSEQDETSHQTTENEKSSPISESIVKDRTPNMVETASTKRTETDGNNTLPPTSQSVNVLLNRQGSYIFENNCSNTNGSSSNFFGPPTPFYNHQQHNHHQQQQQQHEQHHHHQQQQHQQHVHDTYQSYHGPSLMSQGPGQPSMRLFTYQSTSKPLQPPPAYGAAISQLRSQNSQNMMTNPIPRPLYPPGNYTIPPPTSSSSTPSRLAPPLPPPSLNERYQSNFEPMEEAFTEASNKSSASPKRTTLTPPIRPPPHMYRSPQSSLNNQFCRQSSSPYSVMSGSPSVLRFAESPVTAHYLERENGDFIVQETPKHVVECVEKDDGEFSVIERVYHMPPSVVQINEEEEDEMSEHDSNSNDVKLSEDDRPSETWSNGEGSSQPALTEQQQQKKSGITVLSDVQLDLNEYLDLVGNIIASGKVAKNRTELIKIEKFEPEEVKEEEPICLDDDEDHDDAIVNYNQKFEETENQERQTSNESTYSPLLITSAFSQIESSASPSSVTPGTTSVIRLAAALSAIQPVDATRVEESMNEDFSDELTATKIEEKTDLSKAEQDEQQSNSLKREIETTNDVKAVETNTPTKKTEEATNSMNSITPEEDTSQIPNKTSTANPANLEVNLPNNSFQQTMKRPLKKVPKKLIIKPKSKETSTLQVVPIKRTSTAEPIPSIELPMPTPSTSTENSKLENRQKGETITDDSPPQDELNSIKIEMVATSDPVLLRPLLADPDEKLPPEDDAPPQPSASKSKGSEEKLRTEKLLLADEKPTTDLTAFIDECLKKEEEEEHPIHSIFGMDIRPTDETFNNALTPATPTPEFPSSSLFAKPLTTSENLSIPESMLLDGSNLHETDAHQLNQQHQQNNSNYEYPFSFLYGGEANQQEDEVKHNIPAPIYCTEDFNKYSASTSGGNSASCTWYQSQSSENDFEMDGKGSYLDLDSCKRSTSFAAATEGSMPTSDALNIRTDEKMPAKGEISEQESNCGVENSWSQPLFNEFAVRFPNPYQNFMANHESWSQDHYFRPQDLSSSVETKNFPLRLTEEPSPAVDSLPSTSKRKNKIAITKVPRKKNFQCAHCNTQFPLLKEKNAHMIKQHGYKRLNRRLIRDPPTSTVTTATLNAIDTAGAASLLLGLDGNAVPCLAPDVENEDSKAAIVKVEQENQECKNKNLSTLAISSTKVSSSSTTTNNASRTKYDSMRARDNRMLINFNLNALNVKKEGEVHNYYLESKSSFCCFVCKRDFLTVKLFDEHLVEHPAECFTCHKKFTRWKNFMVHLKRHLGWKDFACTYCEKKFVIRSALVEHMRMHTGHTPLKCKICGKSFKRYSNLTQHRKRHGTKINRSKEYVCFCGEVLPSKARFIWHKETHDLKPKCCPYCRDRFVHANSLRRHIRLAHSDKFDYTEPMECPMCKQIYAKSSIKAHMATHSMDTQHECLICSKSFSTKWNLKIHNWVHANRTTKPFKCEQCVKAFVREVDYNNHINSHKQIKPYTCEHCGCKFIRKYNYIRHRREHHGNKKFTCDLCGKLFHRHYYLIEHRRIHTGERPFQCTICGKSSTTKTNHNKHLKIHHSRDPFTSEA